MGGRPGHKLQIIHPLLRTVFPIPVTNLALLLREGEAFEGEQRTDNVFTDPLGVLLGLSPDLAVNVEPGIPLGEDLLVELSADERLLQE